MSKLIYLLMILSATLMAAEENPMNLGSQAEIQLSVKDLKAAEAYYLGLGFSLVTASENGSVALTDGNIVLALHTEPFTSPRVAFYGADLSGMAEALAELGLSVEVAAKTEAGEVEALTFALSDGQHFYVSSKQAAKRENVAFEHWNPEKLPTEDKHFSRMGIFAEFALPVKDRAATAAIVEKLGFGKLFESNGPYPWGIYANEVFVFGLHQTKDFSAAGITFFSKDSAKRIESLKGDGHAFKAEMDANNAVLEAPNGETLFLFGTP